MNVIIGLYLLASSYFVAKCFKRKDDAGWMAMFSFMVILVLLLGIVN